MTKKILLLSTLLLLTLSCSLLTSGANAPDAQPPAPEGESASSDAPPAAEEPEPVVEDQPAADDADRLVFGHFSFVLPPAVAGGASEEIFPPLASEEAAPWELTPGHQQITLDGYALQDKFHQPRFYVYPAQEYAAMIPSVPEDLQRINDLVTGFTLPFSDSLPSVPFFNAAQAFASNIEVIEFRSGSGVRFLTEYSQYPAPVNNHDLFYQFQGITADGMYYIIGVFPITATVLAESSDPAAAVPPGGIAAPDYTDPDADFAAYYGAMAALLDGTPGESFAPALTELDRLIQSIEFLP